MPKKPKKAASQLLTDNDGHWYLIPESQVVAFESTVMMLHDDGHPDSAINQVAQFEKYRVDNPHRLRIIKWEEMD